MMKPIEELLRPNISTLAPYSSARDEYAGHEARVFLDANENPYNSPLNRYPDPLQRQLKKVIAKVKQVPEECIFVGNGSDEAIDLPYRCFCRPGIDNVVAIEPTYGMYRVCADINDVEYRPVLLDEHFRMSAQQMLDATDNHTKIIWLCSPNNPTGNNLDKEEIRKILDTFQGLVILDEAYSDFSRERSFRFELANYPNLIILNTLSKAWGCAAIRMGMAFASPQIIGIINKVKYPYNVNQLTQEQAIKTLSDTIQTDKWVRILLQERERLMEAFRLLPICKQVYPSEANFFLARMTDAKRIYDYLVTRGVIVRNRTHVTLCQNCLRITVGTRTENSELMAALRQYQ